MTSFVCFWFVQIFLGPKNASSKDQVYLLQERIQESTKPLRRLVNAFVCFCFCIILHVPTQQEMLTRNNLYIIWISLLQMCYVNMHNEVCKQPHNYISDIGKIGKLDVQLYNYLYHYIVKLLVTYCNGAKKILSTIIYTSFIEMISISKI